MHLVVPEFDQQKKVADVFGQANVGSLLVNAVEGPEEAVVDLDHALGDGEARMWSTSFGLGPGFAVRAHIPPRNVDEGERFVRPDGD